MTINIIYDGIVVGTVGSLYYERYSIKELIDMYCRCGAVLRFAK